MPNAGKLTETKESGHWHEFVKINMLVDGLQIIVVDKDVARHSSAVEHLINWTGNPFLYRCTLIDYSQLSTLKEEDFVWDNEASDEEKKAHYKRVADKVVTNNEDEAKIA